LADAAILPEFFALLSIDVFLLLSLLTCLLEERFPKALPYIYQIAALVGFGHLLVSRDFLLIFGEYMRFWYNFFYLLVALGNIVALNLYLAVNQKMWTLAKAWSGAVTFPLTIIAVFFVSNYSYLQGAEFPTLLLQLGLVVSTIVMGVSISVFLSPDLLNKFRKKKEVNEWK
jgi:energy-converting hydrogenase Eha subunit A